MCERCVELLKQYYPHLSEADAGELLMGATAFPFASPEYIEKQLKELREKTDGSLHGALVFAKAALLSESEQRAEGK